ncbi:MAG: nucleotidyltransferase domain-containing protein [Acidobacteriia bacterium]|nr:nucleotidyltransferase domain-containing protein [Terriglobia bacterium]
MDAGIAIVNETSKWSRAILARIASEPLRAAGVKRAVAFGSYARGVAGRQSDLDLVVVIETDLPRLEGGRLRGDSCDSLPASLDVLVSNPAEFEQGKRVSMSLQPSQQSG